MSGREFYAVTGLESELHLVCRGGCPESPAVLHPLGFHTRCGARVLKSATVLESETFKKCDKCRES